MAYHHLDALLNTTLPGVEWTGHKPHVLRSVASVICARAYKTTGKCHPSNAGVVANSQVPESTAKLALGWLELFGLFLRRERQLSNGADTSPEYTVRNVMEVSWISGNKERHGIAFQGWCWTEDGSPCGPGGMAARPPWGISYPDSAFEVLGHDHVVDPANPLDVYFTWPSKSLFVVVEGFPGDPEQGVTPDKRWVACPYELASPDVVDALAKRGRGQLLTLGGQQLRGDGSVTGPSGSAVGLWVASHWPERGQVLMEEGSAIGLKQVKTNTEGEHVSQQVIRTWKAEAAIRSYLLSNSDGYKLKIGKSSPFHYSSPKDEEEEDEDEGDIGNGEEHMAPPSAPVPPAAAEGKGICQVPAAEPPPPRLRPAPPMPSTQPPPTLKAPSPAPAPKPYDPREDPALRLEFARAQHMGMEVGEDIFQAFAAQTFNEGVAADFDRWLIWKNDPPPAGDPLADREKRLAFVRKKEAWFAKSGDAERHWGYWADQYYRWDDAKLAEFYEFVKKGEP